MGGNPSPHVVICFAAGDRGVLQPATDLLESRSIRVQLLEAARIITPDLIVAAGEIDANAAWVLCESDAFNPGRVARMQTILRGRGIPDQHIHRVSMDWRDPLALLQRLQEAGALGRKAITAPQRPVPLEHSRPPTRAKPAAPAARRAAPAAMPAAPAAKPAAPTPMAAVSPEPPSPPPPQDVGSVPPVPTPAPADIVAPMDHLHDADEEPTRIAQAPRAPSRLTFLHSKAARIGLGAAAGLLLLGGLAASLLGGDAEAPAAAETSTPEPAAPVAPVADVEEEDDEELPDAEPGTVPAWVHEAVARGELAVFEDLVYAPPVPTKMTFRDTQALCEKLAGQESSAWRMPRLGELHRLTRENVLPREVYWSGTEAEEFGNRGLVWSAKKMRAAPIAKGWRGARGVCILDLSGG